MKDLNKGISVRNIEVFSARGRGVFKGENSHHELDFILHRQLSRFAVCVSEPAFAIDALSSMSLSLSKQSLDEPVTSIINDGLFSLSGRLADGRPVLIRQLLVVHIGELVELCPHNCAVEIGSRGFGAPVRSCFFLTGLYEGSFSLTSDELHIELVTDIEAKNSERAARGIGIPLDGSTLVISSEHQSHRDHEAVAADIMLLLSLACGTGITSHRWEHQYQDKHRIEFWQRWIGDDTGPGPVVRSEHLKVFAAHAHPTWERMSEDEQVVLRNAIIHLNNSGTGYLDTRLFQTAQIWEYLAAQWTPKADLSQDEKELKAILKKARREWAKTYPNADPNGLIGDRIAKAFDWQVLRRQIESLAAQFEVDLSILGLDIESLKVARDSVAHSITLKDVGSSSGSYVDTLLRSQYGLQIILLLKLQYEGLVIDRMNGWTTNKHVHHLKSR